MANLAGHGGACCGIQHLYGMDNCSIAALDFHIDEHERGNNENNRVLEIILSARQVENARSNDDGRIHPSIQEAGGWGAVLAARGFRLTESWLNSNSGRNCYRFIKLNSFREDENRLPIAPGSFTGIRQAAVIPPAPVARPVRVVFATFHNVFRGERGRSDAGWNTYAQANQNAPRARRVDRRDIMSDGTIVWVENVTRGI